jgi:hypothetical protein
VAVIGAVVAATAIALPGAAAIGASSARTTAVSAASTSHSADGEPAIASAPIDVRVGPEVILDQSADIRQIPTAFAWETMVDGQLVRKIGVGYSTHEDSSSATLTAKHMYSLDDGASWHDADTDTTPSAQLRDGTLVDLGFYMDLVPGSGDFQATMSLSRSTDGGESYQTGTALLTSDTRMTTDSAGHASFVIQGRMIEDADGNLYQTAYGRYDGDAKRRSVLLKSTDGGQNWAIESTIGYNPDLFPTTDSSYEGFGESSVVQLNDGSFLAVMRTGSWRPMYYARSTDLGQTWTEPQQMTAGPDQQDVPGIDPTLILMPNGVLAMVTGRSDTRLYLSADGRGEHWDAPTVVSAGRDSGNAGMVVLDANRLLIVGDKGLYPGRPPTGDYIIWSKTVTVLPQPVNRIDLATGYQDGSISVDTDLTATSAANPAVGVAAAFDGLTDYADSAMTTQRNYGHFTIDLQSARTLTDIGVGLKAGLPEDADVYLSLDGSNWQRVRHIGRSSPVSMLYTDLGATSARYVKIEVRSATAPAALSEVELYTNAMTFDNDAAGTAPAGCESSHPGPVSSDDGVHSRQSLHLHDDSTTSYPSVTCTELTPYHEASLTFAVKPIDLNGSILRFTVLGYTSSAPGVPAKAYDMAIRADGHLQWWDGSAWHQVPNAPAVAFGQWNTISIDMPAAIIRQPGGAPSDATLTVNGGPAGTIGLANRSVIMDLRGFTFYAGNGSATGQDAYIDNVSFTGQQ